MKLTSICITACLCITLMATQCSATELIPALTTSGGLSGIPGENSVHGWRFNVNSSIRVTHLGLYDHLGDGFLIDHSIGVFRLSDAALLISGTVLQGTDNLLLNDFRYIDTPDITLEEGQSYVIAFHSAQGFADRVISNPTEVTFNNAITFTAALANTGTFRMPTSVSEGFHRIGPSFLFVVPEPSTMFLAAFSLLIIGLSRPKGVAR